ncbi:MAG: exodeoxyribonuclease III [Patescibacteria group bacterium]
MKTFLSWNVNGIRAAERKGFVAWLAGCGAQIVAVQETKVSDHGVLSADLLAPDGYVSFWHGATEKKGYSGVACFVKKDFLPKKVKTDFGKNSLLNKEGRVIELEYDDFTFLNIYFPNGGASEERLKFKLEFYAEFLDYIKKLVKNNKQVIFCGDVNTAHQEIDLARPKENANHSGFMRIERDWLDKFAENNLIDTFRHFYPDKAQQYTWWDQKTAARERDVGWRIDYFYVSSNLKNKITDAFILADVLGSDHCPVGLKVDL